MINLLSLFTFVLSSIHYNKFSFFYHPNNLQLNSRYLSSNVKTINKSERQELLQKAVSKTHKYARFPFRTSNMLVQSSDYPYLTKIAMPPLYFVR